MSRSNGGGMSGATGDPTDSRQTPPANAQVAAPLRPGEWYPAEPYRSASEEKPPDKNDSKKDTKSLAKDRGRDWGLRDASRSAIAMTRPIRVHCWSDHLVLLSEQGWADKTIPFEGRTEKAIDKFIHAVWEHMDTWGIAGRGMYWRPILEVYIAPGGEDRFAEFKALLEGSGLNVERKQ